VLNELSTGTASYFTSVYLSILIPSTAPNSLSFYQRRYVFWIKTASLNEKRKEIKEMRKGGLHKTVEPESLKERD
jgi:hypothetical protein